MKKYVKLIRAKHWIKNILIFIPIVFSKNLFDANLYANLLIGFVIFSLIASTIYIINDICDINHDRLHEEKKKRPLASGKIKIGNAIVVATAFLIISVFLMIFLTIKEQNNIFLTLPMAYLVINFLYSKGLKNVPIVDISILSFGFFARVLYGALLINVSLSNWLFLMIIFGALYLSLGKRRNEFIKQEITNIKTRKVLEKYTKEFLDKNMYVCLTLAIVCYSLWCTDSNIIGLLGNNYLIWTVPIFLIVLLCYNLSVESVSSGDPVEVILGNKVLMLMILVFGLSLFLILYIL